VTTFVGLRRLVLAAALLPSMADAIDPAMSGLWHSPSSNGQGMTLMVLEPSRVAITWYNYSASGQPTWLAGVLTETLPWVLQGDLYFYRGSSINDTAVFAPEEYRWGQVELSIESGSCDRATLEYDSSFAEFGAEPAGRGAIAIIKLGQLEGLRCGAPRSLSKGEGIYAGSMKVQSDGSESPIYVSIDESLDFVALAPGKGRYAGRLQPDAYRSYRFTSTQVETVPDRRLTSQGLRRSFWELAIADNDWMSANVYDPIWNGVPATVKTHWMGATHRGISGVSVGTLYFDESSDTGLVLAFTGNIRVRTMRPDQFGCRYEGELSAELRNPFRFELEVAGCEFAGTHQALAIILDRQAPGDNGKLILSVGGEGGPIAAMELTTR
jgi:hypothetical protein